MKKKRIVSFLLACVMLVSLSACKGKKTVTSGDNGSAEDSTFLEDTSDSSDSDDLESLSDESDINGDAANPNNPAGTGKSGSAGKTGKSSTNGGGGGGGGATSSSTAYFNVEDYGARGDGTHDDGPAVYKAVMAAAKDGSAEKIVQFKANTTYRLASVPGNYNYNTVISCSNADGVKVRGNNTKLLMKAPCRVASFENSNNIEFSGFIIDYSPKPFALGKVTNINVGDCYIDFSTTDDLGFTGDVTPPKPYFAFRNRTDERRHYNINKMTKLSDNNYRFYFDNPSNVGLAQMGEDFILPIYGSSHGVGGAFSISSVNNFEMKNVSFYSVPEFICGLRYNKGYTKFTNVRIEPAPGSPIHLVSWRDGFHVKDNLSQLTWDNCYVGPIGDDAFNLSTVIFNVDSFNTDLNTISMVAAEDANSKRDGLAAGDEVCAYDLKTGKDLGTAKIEKVLPANNSVNIKIDRTLPLTRGCQVAIYRYNKNFVVKNSYIEGTVRVRTIGTFQNCKFNVFWVRVENESYVEGPIPKDITFSVCSLTTPYDSSANIFHVGTQTSDGSSASYKCKNIVLDNCQFLKGTYNADDGNELIVR